MHTHYLSYPCSLYHWCGYIYTDALISVNVATPQFPCAVISSGELDLPASSGDKDGYITSDTVSMQLKMLTVC